MKTQHIMFLGLLFVVGTVISLTFSGGWLTTSHVGVLNSISGFRAATILGVWQVQVPNLDFITVGITALSKLDFAFFGGTMGLLRWLFIFTVGAATVWGIFTITIYALSGLWRR